MSRVFRDLLNHLDLTAATQQPAAAQAAAAQQHCCCCCAAAPSTGADKHQTNKQTNKHPGTTIRLTLCERDAIGINKKSKAKTAVEGRAMPAGQYKRAVNLSVRRKC